MAISAASPGKIKGTSITTPTKTVDNHALVLGQLKETTEIAQRLRGDPNDSFVRVSEINSALGTRLVNNTLQPPNTTTLSSSGTVTTADSVTGTGASGAPIKLVNDVSSPGNNMVYGTNGSGVLGWYAGSASSSLSVTDGTHTVTGVTSLTFSGATISGTSPNATATISGGSSVAVPGTTPDLIFWMQADQSLISSGNSVQSLQNYCPWNLGYSPQAQSSGVTRSSTTLNSKGVYAFPGSTSSEYEFTAGAIFVSATVFVVYQPTVASTGSFLCGGASGSFEFDINSSGYLQILKSFVVSIAVDTTALATGTWYQANVVYNGSTGAYAFRVARTASSSGTNAQTFTSGSNGVGYDPQTGGQQLNGLLAEMIVYNRALTSTEISNIEAYLHTKWGV